MPRVVFLVSLWPANWSTADQRWCFVSPPARQPLASCEAVFALRLYASKGGPLFRTSIGAIPPVHVTLGRGMCCRKDSAACSERWGWAWVACGATRVTGCGLRLCSRPVVAWLGCHLSLGHLRCSASGPGGAVAGLAAGKMPATCPDLLGSRHRPLWAPACPSRAVLVWTSLAATEARVRGPAL